ncbi:TOBE domain protein [compost metagenome]
MAAGEQVSVCLGAEHIQLGERAALANRLECRVVGEEFIGSMVNIHLESASGLELQVQKPHAEYDGLGLHGGQKVFAGWDSANALILRGE